jgi:hypothetical protein
MTIIMGNVISGYRATGRFVTEINPKRIIPKKIMETASGRFIDTSVIFIIHSWV